MTRVEQNKKARKKGSIIILLAMLICAGIAGYSGFQVFASGSPEAENIEPASQENAEPAGENMGESLEAIEEEFVLLNDAEAEMALEAEAEQTVPTGLSIPSIDVSAELEPKGVLDNGQMGVPSTEDGVAWFEPGAKPGEKGNAVMAGHVDSRTGPAVFYDLDKLDAGDEIEVTDEKGEVLTFEVKRAVSYDRTDAPIEDIFGPSNTRSLNLITCTGTFDQAEGTHDQRLVVYTELQEEDVQKIENGDPPEAPGNVVLAGSQLSFHAVRDEDVAGYRVYEKNPEGENRHIESIAVHERKSYSSPDLAGSEYYVTTVDVYGQESEPSETAE
ncbi:LPXTG-site transpeptidase (sortase) family protein [Sinobaca qinghaiensis]|uniref:LPXTG-site transpeptidase (Sortase) family protein n=1 Tax=Sinobaca qinghaiensis TaxID=342944 RepID=A0A419UWC0_9BACL|nr:class F sortase [Sinobaca qinghaiensis]RKD69432.1 LPXTG-site transpeptidase (sortase) family protein [Sinobaca qinghaiensis]